MLYVYRKVILVNLVLVTPLLRDRLLFSRTVDWEKITSEHLDFLIFPIRHIPESLAARHIRSFGLGPMTDDTFEQLYAPLETFLFSDRLPLNVVVPILFLHFDFDEYRVDDRIMLRRLEPGFHLARYAINPFHREVNRCVMSAATHSFVLDTYEVENTRGGEAEEVLSEVDAYPNLQIEMLFAALRSVADVPTGYAQLLCEPIGWHPIFSDPDLLPLLGTSVRRYPLWFEDYYWNTRQLPHVSVVDMQRVSRLFKALSGAKENALPLAARRLNNCYIRSEPEDRILDATIALESLVGDDERQEMTHKLALRVAALTRFEAGELPSAVTVFKDIKRIYGYRSAIVHGSTTAEKKREIALPGGKRIDAVELAVKYARMTLRILAEHPEYRDPSIIDQHLLLRNGEVNRNVQGEPNLPLEPTGSADG